MKTRNMLIILSALLILPGYAYASDSGSGDDLEVTMEVVETPNDSTQKITNRIEVPTGEYLQARERNRMQHRYVKGDGDEHPEDGAQDMYRYRTQTREMIRDQQQSEIKETIGGTQGAGGYGQRQGGH